MISKESASWQKGADDGYCQLIEMKIYFFTHWKWGNLPQQFLLQNLSRWQRKPYNKMTNDKTSIKIQNFSYNCHFGMIFLINVFLSKKGKRDFPKTRREDPPALRGLVADAFILVAVCPALWWELDKSGRNYSPPSVKGVEGNFTGECRENNANFLLTFTKEGER
jgi:hypothetical protein